MSDHAIIYVSFYQAHFVFVNSFLKITECFTHVFFLLQPRHWIAKTPALDLMWVLLSSLLITFLIVFEKWVTVLIRRLFKFLSMIFVVELLGK